MEKRETVNFNERSSVKFYQEEGPKISPHRGIPRNIPPPQHPLTTHGVYIPEFFFLKKR